MMGKEMVPCFYSSPEGSTRAEYAIPMLSIVSTSTLINS